MRRGGGRSRRGAVEAVASVRAVAVVDAPGLAAIVVEGRIDASRRRRPRIVVLLELESTPQLVDVGDGHTSSLVTSHVLTEVLVPWLVRARLEAAHDP